MKYLLRIVCLVLTVAWLGVIFWNSTDSGEESSEKSGAVYEIVNEVAQAVGIEEEIPESTIRTSAHFLSFAVLSVLLCLDLLLFFSLCPAAPLSPRLLLLLLTLPVCSLLAAVDEWIQSFSPGRATELLDVGVDSLGALCGLVGFFLIWLLLHAILHRPTSKASAHT